ncbi:Fe-S oxidoreductase [Bacillus sp. Bva_UNVM-123]|uniref:CC/Se motif family (seleno)protein n=1 Tax=Bacillus sp. Bva_UNVM-123 TaxID=2829798 RepID=UPI00391F73B9
MQVEMDSASKMWIESKGRQLTVKILEVSSCCAPSVQEVVAVPGRPKTLHQFNELMIDNLSIYIQKTLYEHKKLSLTLSGFSFLKSISAKLQ